jgi:hypothetical protein
LLILYRVTGKNKVSRVYNVVVIVVVDDDDAVVTIECQFKLLCQETELNETVLLTY